MKESNSRRICYTCGKKYRYCSHCPEFRNMPEWMNITCCEECHDLYLVCANFNLGKYSKEEAQDILSKYDLSQISISRPNMIRTLQKIYGQEEVETPVVVEMTAVEEEVPGSNNDTEKDIEAVETEEPTENIEISEEISDEPEQPKSRRRKKTLAVLDELDE